MVTKVSIFGREITKLFIHFRIQTTKYVKEPERFIPTSSTYTWSNQ